MEPRIKQKLDDFFSSYGSSHYKKGELLARAGENPSGIFYLQEGVVRQYVISQKGEEVILNIYKSGAFFPMSWVVADISNNYYYEAMTDTVVKKASKSEVKSFVEKEPEIVLDLLQRMYRGIEGVLLHIEQLISGDSRIKLLTTILIFAKRFGQPHKDGTLIDLSMTQNDLAAYSGIARETVSRELTRLIKEDLLTFAHQRLIIKDLQKLQEEVTPMA